MAVRNVEQGYNSTREFRQGLNCVPSAPPPNAAGDSQTPGQRGWQDNRVVTSGARAYAGDVIMGVLNAGIAGAAGRSPYTFGVTEAAWWVGAAFASDEPCVCPM